MVCGFVRRENGHQIGTVRQNSGLPRLSGMQKHQAHCGGHGAPCSQVRRHCGQKSPRLLLKIDQHSPLSELPASGSALLGGKALFKKKRDAMPACTSPTEGCGYEMDGTGSPEAEKVCSGRRQWRRANECPWFSPSSVQGWR